MRSYTEQDHLFTKLSGNPFLNPTATLVIKMLALAVGAAFVLILALIVIINYVVSALIETLSPPVITAIIIVPVMFFISLIGLIIDVVRERNIEKHLAELRKTDSDFLSMFAEKPLNALQQDTQDE